MFFLAATVVLRFAVFGVRIVEFSAGLHRISFECAQFLKKSFPHVDMQFSLDEPPESEVHPKISVDHKGEPLDAGQLRWIYGDPEKAEPSQLHLSQLRELLSKDETVLHINGLDPHEIFTAASIIEVLDGMQAENTPEEPPHSSPEPKKPKSAAKSKRPAEDVADAEIDPDHA